VLFPYVVRILVSTNAREIMRPRVGRFEMSMDVKAYVRNMCVPVQRRKTPRVDVDRARVEI